MATVFWGRTGKAYIIAPEPISYMYIFMHVMCVQASILFADVIHNCLVLIQGMHMIRKICKNSVALVRKRTIPTERPPLSAK
jgi:hypothetical protein